MLLRESLVKEGVGHRVFFVSQPKEEGEERRPRRRGRQKSRRGVVFAYVNEGKGKKDEGGM